MAGGASSHFEMYVTGSDMSAESQRLIYLLLCKSFNTLCYRVYFVAGGASSHFEMYVYPSLSYPQFLYSREY